MSHFIFHIVLQDIHFTLCNILTLKPGHRNIMHCCHPASIWLCSKGLWGYIILLSFCNWQVIGRIKGCSHRCHSGTRLKCYQFSVKAVTNESCWTKTFSTMTPYPAALRFRNWAISFWLSRLLFRCPCRVCSVQILLLMLTHIELYMNYRLLCYQKGLATWSIRNVKQISPVCIAVHMWMFPYVLPWPNFQYLSDFLLL